MACLRLQLRSGRSRLDLGRLAFVLLVLAAGSAALPAAEQRVAVPTLPISPASPLPDSLRRIVPASVDELRAIEDRVQSLYSRLQETTVGIRRGPAQGSGVIISKDGYVLTAAHVSGKPGSEVTVILADGTELDAKSLGRETYVDAGLIKILEQGKWPVAALGDIREMRPGDWVLGLGHPGGFQADRPSVPRLGRLISVQDSVLRTDVALIGGDSGGPLFDLNGRVIGIHSRIGADPNLNFHVPINVYRDNWYWLLASEQRPTESHVGGPVLGVNGEDGDRGCRVTRVFADSPAQRGGLQVNDLILRVDERFILGMDDLVGSVNQYSSDDTVEITVLRKGERKKMTIRLGERSAKD